MSKTIKTISIVACLFIALIVAGVLLLPKLLNTGTFKQQLTQQFEQHTGQTLTITGDVKLSLFPWLSLHTSAISISQPIGLVPKNTQINKPLLKVESAKIGLKLLPLLQSKIELSKIELNRPQLHFIVTENGATSLASANNTKAVSTPNSDNGSATDKQTSAFSAIAISGISIIDGDFIYEDQAQASLYRLSGLNIEAGDILSLEPTAVDISALVSVDNDTNNNSGTDIESFSINISSEVSHSPDLLSATLQKVIVDITESGNPQPKPTRKLNATINKLAFNQQSQILDIEQLNLIVDNGQLSPELSIPSVVLALNTYTTPVIPFVLAEKTLDLKARGEILIKDWNKEAFVKGRIDSDTFSPKKVLNFLEIDYKPTDDKVLNISQFSSTFNGSAHGLALHDINFTLDESYFAGDVSIMNFEDPHYMFDLDLDQINIDRYIPIDTSNSGSSANSSASNTAANTTASTSQQTTGLAITAPLPLFKKIHANGMFRTTNLQAKGAKLSNIVVDVKSKNKEVIIKPKATLYDGKMDGTITFKDKGDLSTLRIENNLQGVNFGPLLEDTSISEKIEGKGTTKTDILFTERNGIQTNNGTISVSVLDGALKDIDIKKILDDAQNNIDALRGKEIKPETDEEQETRFAQMNATLKLNNNIITNDDLAIKAPGFRVGGKGDINLAAETLDYTTSVVVVNTNDGQGGKNREDLRGLDIPVRFYGSLEDPKYKIDFAALLKENGKRELARKKDELRLKAAEKLGLVKKDAKDDISKEDFETQLKEKVVEKLFQKLF